MKDFKIVMQEMKNLYLGDKRPWIIGFSGGKDSTCITQLIYYMIKGLPENKRDKKVYIVSSDTLVESPYIQSRIINSCLKIKTQSLIEKLPIKVEILRPELNDTFWVNLIGRGYPSPNQWFRWCTDRLKIRHMSKFTLEQVKENGEVIIVLGARKDESASRAQTMGKYQIKNFRLRSHSNIAGAYLYTPIEDWSFEDVWIYLLQSKSPWGDNNRDLLNLYRKCDSECPLVIDEKTPSCGGSRFGCWVCTVVERDRAIEGLIENGESWLEPLLELRNWLKRIRNDPNAREPIRKSEEKKKRIADFFGKSYVQPEHRGHKILGPFTFEIRHEIFRRIVKMQNEFTKRKITLISPEEIKAIETLWIYEGDNISAISDIWSNDGTFQKNHENILKKEKILEICNKFDVSINLIERLIVIEKDFSKLSRRAGIYNRLEKVIEEEVNKTFNKDSSIKKC